MPRYCGRMEDWRGAYGVYDDIECRFVNETRYATFEEAQRAANEYPVEVR